MYSGLAVRNGFRAQLRAGTRENRMENNNFYNILNSTMEKQTFILLYSRTRYGKYAAAAAAPADLCTDNRRGFFKVMRLIFFLLFAPKQTHICNRNNAVLVHYIMRVLPLYIGSASYRINVRPEAYAYNTLNNT